MGAKQQESDKLRIRDQESLQLCSKVDPIKEAEKWYEFYFKKWNADVALVLGLGYGHHIQQIIINEPNIKIIIFENNLSLIQKFESKKENIEFVTNFEEKNILTIVEKHFDMFCVIAPFRPAWFGREDAFSKIWRSILKEREERNYRKLLESTDLWKCLKELIFVRENNYESKMDL